MEWAAAGPPLRCSTTAAGVALSLGLLLLLVLPGLPVPRLTLALPPRLAASHGRPLTTLREVAESRALPPPARPPSRRPLPPPRQAGSTAPLAWRMRFCTSAHATGWWAAVTVAVVVAVVSQMTGRPRPVALAAITGTSLGVVGRHERSVAAVAVSPAGRTVVSLGRDGTVKFWDAALGVLLSRLPQIQETFAMTHTADGCFLVTGTASGGLQLYDIKTGALVRTLRGRPVAHRVCADGVLRPMAPSDAVTPTPSTGVVAWNGHALRVTCVVCTADSHQLLSGGADGSVVLWDVDSGQPELTFVRHREAVIAVAHSQSAALFASCSEDGLLLVWDAATGEVLHHIERAESSHSLTFSPDGTALLAVEDQATQVWDMETGRVALSLVEPAGRRATAAAYSPDGTLIATGASDGNIRLWDAASGAALGQPLRGHTLGVTALAFHPDGEGLLAGGDDGTVRAWRLRDTRTPAPTAAAA
eukprot:EG_transcript_8694